MQEAFHEMNLLLPEVITDITGKTGLPAPTRQTGMAIMEAIPGGERDPQKLAKLRDLRVKKNKANIAKALEDHYRTKQLLALAA